jgi:hypothetical protein
MKKPTQTHLFFRSIVSPCVSGPQEYTYIRVSQNVWLSLRFQKIATILMLAPTLTPPPTLPAAHRPQSGLPARTNTINWGIYMTYIGGSDRIQKRFVEEKGKGKNVEGSKNSVTFRLAFPSCATLLNHFSSPMDRGFPFLLGPRFNLERSSSRHQKARQCPC